MVHLVRVLSRRRITRIRHPLPEGMLVHPRSSLTCVSTKSYNSSLQFGEKYAKVEAKKASGLELACDYCDGWPVFETEAEFTRHYFKNHLSQKMEEHMAYLTDFNAVVAVRQLLDIDLYDKKDEADRAPGLSMRPPHICPVCFKESSSYELLKKHYVTEHEHDVGKGEADEQEPAVPCAMIIEKFVQQMSELEDAIEFEDDKKSVCALPIEVKGDPRNVVALKKVVPQMHLLSENVYPGVEHRWLCDGKLLLLEHQKSPEAFKLFQDHWLRGQPVVIANSGKYLNPDLWTPESFSRDFGKVRHTLVNCLKGTTVPNAKLKDFWDGFQHVTKRLKDEQGTPMLLKLKDWPPDGDIAEFMPDRFNDLMKSLPMPEYTLRSGRLNIAGYIPDYFLKPELGPKMYIAYGSALYPHKGSTNLHIDMSDAVNCLVYVGLPKDGDERENTIEVFKEVDKAGMYFYSIISSVLMRLKFIMAHHGHYFSGCDMLMKKRVHDPKCKPGALWHIFHPGDTPKIRDLLKKIALEKGKRLDPHDDPIHDQSTYLDGELRMRLYKEYGVQGKYYIKFLIGGCLLIINNSTLSPQYT